MSFPGIMRVSFSRECGNATAVSVPTLEKYETAVVPCYLRCSCGNAKSVYGLPSWLHAIGFEVFL